MMHAALFIFHCAACSDGAEVLIVISMAITQQQMERENMVDVGHFKAGNRIGMHTVL